MAALTQDAIRTLAGFKGRSAPVVTLYLDVDGRRFVRARDYEQQLDAMVRAAGEQTNGHASANADLQRITDHVRAGIDRSSTRVLAIFSCGTDLWQVVELPVPVRNQLVVNATPHVRQLETVLSEHERFGVLLVDRQRARMLVFELGQLVERSELYDELPRHEDDKGDWEKDHVRDHTAEVAHRHVRRAAEVAFHVFQEHPFDHLILGTQEELAHEVERELHSYLRDRIARSCSLPVGASYAVIHEAVQDVEAGIEREKEAMIVARLREAAGAGKAVLGLTPVLGALVERRVDTLLVSDGYEAPGWRCGSCMRITAKGPTCPLCEIRMAQVGDVVEEAVEDAVNQSCRVVVCVGNADLDVQGRIGALLRF